METLNQLLEEVNKKYKTYFEPIKIGNKELYFLQIANMKEYIEKFVEIGGKIESLYWAKIWESSVILAYLLSKKLQNPIGQKKTCLEIGAGVGVAGLFASAFGYEVTITDINKEALLFSKISALKNGLDVKIKKVDFTKDDLNKQYDIILASEVLYNKATYFPLVEFFKRHIKPDGVIYMTQNPKMNAESFKKKLEEDFSIMTKTIRLYSQEDEHTIYFHEIRKKQICKLNKIFTE